MSKVMTERKGSRGSETLLICCWIVCMTAMLLLLPCTQQASAQQDIRTLPDLIKDQLRRQKEPQPWDAAGAPGQKLNCTLVATPSHGKAGTVITITATATTSANTALQIAFREPERNTDIRLSGAFVNGNFETTWTVPQKWDAGDRGYFIHLLIYDKDGNIACTQQRSFWYDDPPVISLDCDAADWLQNTSYTVKADVKRVDDYTFTWFVDGQKVEERKARTSYASMTVSSGSAGNREVKVVVSGQNGTSEASCSRTVRATKFPDISFTSQTSRLAVNQSGQWCVKWEAFSDDDTRLAIYNHYTPERDTPEYYESNSVARKGDRCFSHAFAAAGHYAVVFTITNGNVARGVQSDVDVTVCPAQQKECRGGCIPQESTCCLTGAAGSCPGGQLCCGDGCCGADQQCFEGICCARDSIGIPGKGMCCPSAAPALCGDKCMPAGATCCGSYHCTGSNNYVCCNNNGTCCPSGATCGSNGGCFTACSPPACCAQYPVACATGCCQAGMACCGAGCAPAGDTCCTTYTCSGGAGQVCCGDNTCCPGDCCPEGGCCPADSKCCMGGCCPAPGICSNGCCPESMKTCGNGKCCPSSTECCGGGNCCVPGTCNRSTGQCTGAALGSQQSEGATGHVDNLVDTQKTYLGGKTQRRSSNAQDGWHLIIDSGDSNMLFR